ncbi:MAG: 50S ribosomal protein L35ae [Promethearchaeota archaeon]
MSEEKSKKAEKAEKTKKSKVSGKSEKIEGVFLNYRQSKHVIHPKHAILKFEGYDSRKAAYRLIGKKVGWESSSGKILTGKITRVHGKNGQVVAHFSKAGLPGQALGHKVFIIK